MDAKLYSFIFILFICVSYCHTNQVDFTANPNCTKECQDPWVIYGNRQTEAETIHYLYGAINKPTFIMMSGAPDSSLSIDWNEIKHKKARSVNLTKIHNLFGFSVQNIILFNDANDTGTMNNVPLNQKLIIPTSDFKWSFSLADRLQSSNFPVYFSSNVFKGAELSKNAGISINLTASANNGRGECLPHLIVSGNSTIFDISLYDLVAALNETSLTSIIKGFKQPRLALDMMIFGSKHVDSFSIQSYKSLDDEHTPGIFNIDNLAAHADNENRSGFMQWRPVAYLTKDRNINFSTHPNFNSTLRSIDHSKLNGTRDSLMYYLFGNKTGSYTATQTIIAFGRPKDGYYSAFNYTAWSFSFGLGYPPREGFSTAVIVIISIGLGIPIVLLVMTAIYITVSKRRETVYTQI